MLQAGLRYELRRARRTVPQTDLPARLLNARMGAYRDTAVPPTGTRRARRSPGGRGGSQALEADVATKRREVERFRIRHSIVSLERDENQRV